MKRNKALLFLALLGAVSLASCSGLKSGPCTVNCGGGNGTLSLTLADTPPTNTSILNFNLPIVGITLTPSSGAPIDLPLTPSSPTLEITRLQSDSAFLGSFSVPAGSYTGISLVYGKASGVFYNGTSAAIGTCAANTVCALPTGATGSITLTTPINVTSSQTVGLALEFNLNNAITTSGGIAIDLSQANVLKAVTLPRTGQATGTLDSIEDFTGIVTTLSGNAVTITSGTRGTLTANVDSNTRYDDPQSLCGANVNLSCVVANKTTISADVNVKSDGTLLITEVDFIDAAAKEDELEGTIYPTTTAGTYGLIVADKTVVTGNASLTAATPGTVVSVTLDLSITYGIDPKQISPTPVGFAGVNDIFAGQTVLARIKSATTVSGNISAVADRLLLRFTRVTGTVSGGPAGSIFKIANLPASFGTFVIAPQVQTNLNYTTFDGVTGISGLVDADSVSIRALYLNAVPTFVATKVRKH